MKVRFSKKLTGLILVLMLVLSQAISVFALPGTGETAATEDSSKGSITIKPVTGITFTAEDTDFDAYQVMTLDYISEGGTAGYVYVVTPVFKAFFASYLKLSSTDDVTSQAVYEAMETAEKLQNVVQEFSKWLADGNQASVAAAKVPETQETITPAGYYKFYNLEDGFYFVCQNSGSGALSAAMANTVVVEVTNGKDITVDQKTGVPTIEKKIWHDDQNVWQDVADSAIGEIVSFRVKVTLPDVSSYPHYELIVTDEMDDSLDLQRATVKIYKDKDVDVASKTPKDGATPVTEYTLSVDPDNHGFKVYFGTKNTDNPEYEYYDAKELLTGLHESEVKALYIFFDCVLNTDAVFAKDSNDNQVKLTYSNNPDTAGTKGDEPSTPGGDDGGSTVDTPWDIVKDYTFEMVVTKVNKDLDLLEGAEFELYEGEKTELNSQPIALLKKDGVYYVKGSLSAPEGYTETTTIVTDATGKIRIKGLDDDVTYYLYETKAPEGYILPEKPVKIKVTATYTKPNDSGVIVENNYVAYTSDQTGLTGLADLTDDETENPEQVIYNIARSMLPETGGMGTTVFYVVGISLMAGAAVLLLLKKRLSFNK